MIPVATLCARAIGLSRPHSPGGPGRPRGCRSSLIGTRNRGSRCASSARFSCRPTSAPTRNFQPLPHFWSPLALAGYAGVAALVRIAVVTGRRARWRAVSFGIWWFLITLLPAAIVPQQAVEADWRMYLPFAGLALATTSAAFLVFERLSALPRIGVPVGLAAPILALGLLPLLAWATWERNQTWLSEENLWADVIAKDPGNGRALMNYGLILISEYDTLLGERLPETRRGPASARRPAGGPSRATGCERGARRRSGKSLSPRHRLRPFLSARVFVLQSMAAEPSAERRSLRQCAESGKTRSRDDLVARHTLMDIYADRSDWTSLLRVANESLRLDPNDPDGLRGLRVAQTGVDEVRRIEKAVQSQSHSRQLSQPFRGLLPERALRGQHRRRPRGAETASRSSGGLLQHRERLSRHGQGR